MDATDCTIHYIKNDFPVDLISWVSYLPFPAISPTLSNSHFIYDEWDHVNSNIFLDTSLASKWTLILKLFWDPERHDQLVWYNNDQHCYCLQERSHSIPPWAWHKQWCCLCFRCQILLLTLLFADKIQVYACFLFTNSSYKHQQDCWWALIWRWYHKQQLRDDAFSLHYSWLMSFFWSQLNSKSMSQEAIQWNHIFFFGVFFILQIIAILSTMVYQWHVTRHQHMSQASKQGIYNDSEQYIIGTSNWGT